MSKYKLTVLFPAYLDVAEAIMTLKDYSKEASARFVDLLYQRFDQLERTPEMYAIYHDFPIYRKMALMGYLVFYTLDTERRAADVHRIVWEKRKITKALLESDE